MTSPNVEKHTDKHLNGDTWKVSTATPSLYGYKVFQGEVEKPDLDEQEYRIIELNNGLRAVLIHDRDADKSAACLSVHVGYLHDPVDIPGLAHFCEHMLTKGSKPFPAPNDFMSFMTSNGGLTNASTGPSMATYWFSIAPLRLKEAISRLAACFHSPLFTPSVTAREIYAVDSENSKNLQDDQRRIFHLNNALCSPEHPWSKFGCGNYASLTEAARKKVEEEGGVFDDAADDGGAVGRETRRRMIEWTEREYCASRMTLAILGKESLDELTEIAVNQFSPITKLNVDPRPRIDDYPWTEDSQSCTVFVEAVKDYYGFQLNFPIPYQAPHCRTRPANYLAHFIGHEGPGSPLSYLKKKGWVLALSVSLEMWNRGIQLLYIFGNLTFAGYMNYQEVVLTIFNYISVIKSSFPLPAYHFDEMKRISELAFQNMGKIQPHLCAIRCSELLGTPSPPQWLLNSDTLVREWDAKSVEDVLSCLIPERVRVTISAKHHHEVAVGDNVQWETEKWYGTQYFIKKFEASFIAKAKAFNTNTALFLPRPNPFIPTSLHVDRRDISQPAKGPKCIYNSMMSTLWHKKDDQFWVPKGEVNIRLKSSLAYATPRHSVLTSLLVEILEGDLIEVTYDGFLAGLSNSIMYHFEGLDIRVSGFNEKLPELLDTVLSRMRNFIITQDRLSVYTDFYRRKLDNFPMQQPVDLCDYYSGYLLSAMRWTPEDKLAELKSVTLDDVQRHKEALLSRLHVEVLVTGNFEKKDAFAMLKLIENRLAGRPLLPAERPLYRSLLLPEGANFVYQRTASDPDEPNSATVVYYHFGDIANRRLRATLDLLHHLIKEPTFSELRTKQQLGYIVSTYRSSSTAIVGLRILIQSLRDPTVLDERIEEFLANFGSLLEDMSDDDFASQKEGLIAKKLEKHKNLTEEASSLWGQIQPGYYDFSQNERDADVIRDLKKEDVLDAYKTYLHPRSASRKKISVHLLSQHLKSVLPPPEGVVKIEDAVNFKAHLLCSSVATPVDSSLIPAIKETLL